MIYKLFDLLIELTLFIGVFNILCCITAVLGLIYFYSTSNNDFWKKRGVNGPTTSPRFISLLSRVILGNLFIGDFFKIIYEEHEEEPLVGMYEITDPCLMVKDLDLVKKILIKDFSSFPSRGAKTFKKQVWENTLFGLDAKRWRPIRQKLVPAFSTKKVKDFFSVMSECAEAFEKDLNSACSQKQPIDIMETVEKFYTDFFSNYAFGVHSKGPVVDTEMYKMFQKISLSTRRECIGTILRQSSFQILNFLGTFFINKKVTNFFIDYLNQAMKRRDELEISRSDLVDAVKDLKDQPQQFDFELNDTILVSQSLFFFGAGFEISTITLANALYELALNQSLQEELRHEIAETMKRENGSITYDVIGSMPFLDKVCKEALRLYPSISLLLRRSETEYTFEKIGVTIPKKVLVIISVLGIHKDPKYFPNPDVFDPERFNEDVARKRHEMSFLPFGAGPRKCIGDRLGKILIKIGLIKVLEKYKVEICDETVRQRRNKASGFLLRPKDKIYLKMVKIDDNRS